MRHAFLRLIGLLCLLPLLAWAAPATVSDGAKLLEIPSLKARVTDLTGSLTPPDIEALEYRLKGFEERKGAQLVVLILPTTQPETIEQFGIRLFDTWKVGRKGVDDGVMLIVAKDDRTLRIEVGYGLEGALSDATAKRIIEELIVPRFKEGDVPGGVQAGVQAIIKVVDGEALPANTQAPFAGGYLQDVTLPDELGFVFLAAVILGGPTLRLILGSLLGSAIVAVVCGTAGWLFLGGWMGFASGAVMGLLLSFLLRGGRRSSGGSGILGNILGGILSLIFGGGGGGFGGRGGSGGGGGASGRW